tara:strand:+ start:1143 stop:1469 length:327 start_codon:yes stop_codon:yes gene_type:complete
MVDKTTESVEADVTDGEKVSAKEKAMIDRIEKSERLIKNLRKKIRENGTKKDELKAVKFIGVEFDPDTYKNGEDEVNDYLDKGFQFVRDYQTASGLVIALGKFDKGRK